MVDIINQNSINIIDKDSECGKSLNTIAYLNNDNSKKKEKKKKLFDKLIYLLISKTYFLILDLKITISISIFQKKIRIIYLG